MSEVYPEPPKRVTVHDVAKLAGVSSATVDRVLNNRGGVKASKSRRVLEVAMTLGYIDESDRRAVDVGPRSKIVFLLPDGRSRYIGMLGRLIVSRTADFERLRLMPVVDYISSFNPRALAKALRDHAGSAQGIAFMAIEHPLVREAVSQLAADGLPLATLISDIAAPGRVAYFGLENRAAGRTAGELLGRFIGERPAKVAMIAGSLSYRAHGEREMGFLDIVQEMYPNLEVVGLREGKDDEDLNFRLMRTLLTQHPDLDGVYNIGSGAAGVARALREGRRTKKVVFVGHGLTADTREFLMDGTMDAVITQDADDTITRCANFFANARSGQVLPVNAETMRIEIVLRENLPPSRVRAREQPLRAAVSPG
jgi:LacI family transcriptional regulator